MKLGNRSLLILFAGVAFLGACLLFIIEPIAGKLLLPKFGGSPSVWNTSMMFFQAVLLLGYSYAHFAIAHLKIRLHFGIHALLVLAPILLLPLSFPAWSPSGDMPVWSVIVMLSIFMGLPFLVLATSGPLIQRWFSGTKHPRAKNPYFLYAASNLGSFVGLIGYPLVIEPTLSLNTQLNLWSFGYILFAALTILCLILVRKQKEFIAAKKSNEKISWTSRGKWVALAFIPSSLMLGVTSHITNDVAAVPLLWIIPLSIYLLTFVVAFGVNSTERLIQKIVPVVGTAIFLTAVIMGAKVGLPSMMNAIIFITTFGLIALLAHSRLANSKPAASSLTEFYLWVAIGGTLGGVFNSLIAPVIFNNIYEFPVVLLLALPLIVSFKDPGTMKFKTMVLLVLPLAGYNLFKFVDWYYLGQNMPFLVGLIFGLPIATIYLLAKYRPQAFLYGMIPLMLIPIIGIAASNTILSERTFFGVIRLVDNGESKVMLHGTTKHGEQNKDNPHEALSYYHKLGPVGDMFDVCREVSNCKNVASVGLGVGTVAAYGRVGDNFTFYEIDPSVIRIANDPSQFTYLSSSKAQVSTVLGDGRLSLEKVPDKQYDLLIIDAFSSDAIPVHLLTKEAIELYRSKLSQDGVLAIHISNRELRLEPILKAAAKDVGLKSMMRYDSEVGDSARTPSQWVALSDSEKAMQSLSKNQPWKQLSGRDVRVWTDDFSNILSALY